MKANTTAALAAAAVLVTAGAAYAVPSVTNVVMTQRANSRIVDITYELTGEAAIVTLGIETNGIALPDSAVTRLSGDVCKVVGTGAGKAIVWNAGADWPENLTQAARAKVTASSTDTPPQVMVIDLSKGTAASAADPYPARYYTSLDALPYGGVTNVVYKTGLLVLRKLPSGSFYMGVEGVGVYTELTQDFYAGVYEVTQEQWSRVMGGTAPSQFTNLSGPVEKVSYDDIRGTAAQGGGGWPTDGNVYASSFIGRMRDRTGMATFDLPTDAQWEYACRAGTTTYYNDGISASSATQLNVLGWWNGNSGSTTHTAGEKTPNTWGLYDMHGNVWEWCLDLYGGTLAGGIDPLGAESGSTRVFRSGCFSADVAGCRSASRIGMGPTLRDSSLGFRLVRILP